MNLKKFIFYRGKLEYHVIAASLKDAMNIITETNASLSIIKFVKTMEIGEKELEVV